jgi:hypothetical protein
MGQQRFELEQKLIEIRNTASEQLETYRQEWEDKNIEIRLNTDKELTTIQNKFKELAQESTKYGQDFVTGFVRGMESKFDALREAVAEMAAIVDGGVTEPLDIESPSRLMATYGRFIVDGLMNGIKNSLPALENAISVMAGMVNIPTVAVAGTNTNYGGATIYMTVNASNWSDIERELNRRGVRI